MNQHENTNNLNNSVNSSVASNSNQENLNRENQNVFQTNNNNTANFFFNSSATVTNLPKNNPIPRSTSPPTQSSTNQENLIQRRRSTPSWSLTREVKYIKKDRRKKNVEQMLVVFQNDKNDIGRWIDVSELNCPQLIEEYWERKKQMKESNGNNSNNNEEKQSNSTKKTGIRTIKEIIGMIPSQEHKYIYVVNFNDSTKDEYILWKEMRKHFSKQLLKFYEAHIDQENFIIAPPSSALPVVSENHQISPHQSQPQLQQKMQQVQKHHPQIQQQQVQLPQPVIQPQQDIQINMVEPTKNIQHEQQILETPTTDKINESENKTATTTATPTTNNTIPIFLKNNQNFQNIPTRQIQMLQNQVKLQRTPSNPTTKEPAKPSKPQNFSQIQLIQQNLKMMNRK